MKIIPVSKGFLDTNSEFYLAPHETRINVRPQDWTRAATVQEVEAALAKISYKLPDDLTIYCMPGMMVGYSQVIDGERIEVTPAAWHDGYCMDGKIIVLGAVETGMVIEEWLPLVLGHEIGHALAQRLMSPELWDTYLYLRNPPAELVPIKEEVFAEDFKTIFVKDCASMRHRYPPFGNEQRAFDIAILMADLEKHFAYVPPPPRPPEPPPAPGFAERAAVLVLMLITAFISFLAMLIRGR
jgi:hypothetical protein